MGVGKSGRVEFDTLCCTDEINATLSLCRVLRAALYFSESLEGPESEASALALRALALSFIDCLLRHSLILWPPRPQNRHRLPSILCFRSSAVSLPSLPNWSVRSVRRVAEVDGFEEEEGVDDLGLEGFG